MEGKLIKEDGKWSVLYEEHFRIVKNAEGIPINCEWLLKSIPVSKEETKSLKDEYEGRKIEFKIGYICDFDFTSRCTLGRCDCEEIAEEIKILSED